MKLYSPNFRSNQYTALASPTISLRQQPHERCHHQICTYLNKQEPLPSERHSGNTEGNTIDLDLIPNVLYLVYLTNSLLFAL